MQVAKGRVFSYRVKTSTAEWVERAGVVVVLAEHGLAPGSIPAETVEVAPATVSTLDQVLRPNHAIVDWLPNLRREQPNFIDVDCGLTRTIPRSWLIEEQGIVPVVGLNKIDDAIALFL
jgi:hypothetical protein